MTPLNPTRRLLFFAWALVLVVGIASLGGLGFQRKIQTFQPVGAEIEASESGLRVLGSTHPDTGLLPGDIVIIAFGQEVSKVAELQELLRQRSEGKIWVQRGEDDFAAVAYHRPALQIDAVYLIVALIGVLYLLIGLYTCLKDQRAQARQFFYWCTASAAVYILSPLNPVVDDWDRAVHVVDQLARTLLPALTLHFFLLFPSRLIRSWKSWQVATMVYAPSAVLLAYHVDQAYLRGRWFGPPLEHRLRMVEQLELLLLVASALASALILIVRLRQRPDWESKRQIQWVLAGLVGGYLPFLTLYLLPLIGNLETPALLKIIGVGPLALVPVAFAYAIFKYKMLDFSLVLRDVGSYAMTAIVGIFGFQLANLAIRSGVGEELDVARSMLTFAAGLVIAGVLVPARSGIAVGLERLQYGSRLGQRRLLRSLGRELLHERDLDQLCQRLIENLSDGLSARVNLYLARDGGLVPFRHHSDLPRALSANALGNDLWNHGLRTLSATELLDTRQGDEQRLFVAGYRYAFPLRVRDSRLGVAILSHKFDEEPLNSEDIELIRGLLNQAALAIENAQLLEEVHLQLRQVTRLETYNQGILESSPAGIAVLDAEDKVMSANHAFAAICGDERPQVLGRDLERLIPVYPMPDPEDGVIEVSFCQPSGEERYLQLSMAEYQQASGGDSADVAQRVLIVQDVSDRIAMELELRDKERLAALGMLAAGVAHEVNTPLTGISSYAQFLKAEIDQSDPHYTILEKMERQTFRAAQIVNNLLDFSRNRREEMARVPLSLLLAESVDLLADRAATAGVELRWTPPTEPFDVLGNEGELHQTFTNLIVNAIDAVAQQAETRVVNVHLDQNTNGRVRVQVADNGPGIADERIQTIFKPFFSSKLKKGGSGLGLAICYNIVRRHSGEIRAENHVDRRGCTFMVELPTYSSVTH